MIIDMEHHASTDDHPFLQKGDSESGKICERYWDSDGKMRIHVFQEVAWTERRLRLMDEAGIDMAALTTNPMR